MKEYMDDFVNALPEFTRWNILTPVREFESILRVAGDTAKGITRPIQRKLHQLVCVNFVHVPVLVRTHESCLDLP